MTKRWASKEHSGLCPCIVDIPSDHKNPKNNKSILENISLPISLWKTCSCIRNFRYIPSIRAKRRLWRTYGNTCRVFLAYLFALLKPSFEGTLFFVSKLHYPVIKWRISWLSRFKQRWAPIGQYSSIDGKSNVRPQNIFNVQTLVYNHIHSAWDLRNY